MKHYTQNFGYQIGLQIVCLVFSLDFPPLKRYRMVSFFYITVSFWCCGLVVVPVWVYELFLSVFSALKFSKTVSFVFAGLYKVFGYFRIVEFPVGGRYVRSDLRIFESCQIARYFLRLYCLLDFCYGLCIFFGRFFWLS